MANTRPNRGDYRDISYESPVLTSPQFNADYHPKKALASITSYYPVQQTPRAESRAFLPNQTPPSRVPSSRNYIKRVPWLGFLALAASGLTVILSLTILLVVDHHVVWPNSGWSTFMRPASWLSALLSANGIFLHFALEEGLTVAWWYRATRTDATVGELHDAWHHGTSLTAALFAGRRITYISMATIFCALLPLNGFLLQGAISTVLSQESTQVNVYIPMVQQLPVGYSGSRVNDENNNINLINSPFADAWVQVLNLEASPHAGYAYAGVFTNKTTGEISDWGCENTSICTTTAFGVGFDVKCDAKETPYDLLPRDEDIFGVDGTIFYTNMYWHHAQPNTLHLDMRWKDDSSCIGYFQWRNCTLEAAVVEYPVQLQMNISTTNVYPGPYISLIDGTTRKNDTTKQILPVEDDEGVFWTRYGGIAAYFGQYFNSEMNITTYPSNDGSWNGTYYPSGQLCTSLSPGIPQGEPGNFQSYCNMTFEYPLEEMKYQQIRDGRYLDPTVEGNHVDLTLTIDLSEVILEPLRHSMFLASVYQGFAWYGVTDHNLPANVKGNESVIDDYVQERQATQIKPASRYTVRFYLWGASLAVTYLIILFLIPLFWGFWSLKRKPTMSPVDVARAFKAPLLSDYDDETKTLLKHHGRRSVHYDLVSPELRRESIGMQSYFDTTSPRSQA